MQLTAGNILEQATSVGTELRQAKEQLSAVHSRVNATHGLGAQVLDHVLVSTP